MYLHSITGFHFPKYYYGGEIVITTENYTISFTPPSYPHSSQNYLVYFNAEVNKSIVEECGGNYRSIIYQDFNNPQYYHWELNLPEDVVGIREEMKSEFLDVMELWSFKKTGVMEKIRNINRQAIINNLIQIINHEGPNHYIFRYKSIPWRYIVVRTKMKSDFRTIVTTNEEATFDLEDYLEVGRIPIGEIGSIGQYKTLHFEKDIVFDVNEKYYVGTESVLISDGNDFHLELRR